MEILKIVLPFLSGGLAGALINEWFRRRGSKLQAIPLIERVNRLVSPKLEGITLARVTGTPDHQRLEKIENLREYQLTLRNTSSIAVDATSSEPWKKGFRRRIPHLPSTDSIEFSFRAVNPPSDDYEVALYNTDRIVVERSKGEPSADKRSGQGPIVIPIGNILAVVILLVPALWLFSELLTRGTNRAVVNGGGCALLVESSFYQVNPDSWFWKGPWRINQEVQNVGTQKCFVESGRILDSSGSIAPDRTLFGTVCSASRPKLVRRDLAFGSDAPTNKVQVAIYGESQ